MPESVLITSPVTMSLAVVSSAFVQIARLFDVSLIINAGIVLLPFDQIYH